MSVAHTWGSRPEERLQAFPCDGLLRREDAALFRAVDVDAAPAIVYRWLCQMRAAPYSYDWLDNFGRRSPQQWTPGLDELAPGQRFMALFELVSFEPDRHVTIRTDATGRKVFGDIAVSYTVAPRGPYSRLLVKLSMRLPRPPLRWFTAGLGPWLDLIMMRRQLLNFKALSERMERAAGVS